MAEQELQRVRTQIRQEEVCSQTQVHICLFAVSNLTRYLLLYSIKHIILTPVFASSEQQEHVSSMEEKLHSLRSLLQEVQLHGSHQKQTISELQLKNNHQNIEAESLKRRVDELNQVRKLLLCSNESRITFQMYSGVINHHIYLAKFL